MQIRVNGDSMEIDSNISVDQLLSRMEITSSRVAVAINYECVRRGEYATRSIQSGDEIEILAPQAGG